MKSSKPLLFALAGVWTALLMIEKVSSLVSSVKVRNSALPIKIIFYGTRIIRSILLFGLVVVNVFMAIALFDSKK